MAHGQIETVLILESHAVIITKGLLVQISEQMERLDAYVGTFQAAFEKRSKILQAVGMNFAACIFNGVVNNFMLKLIEPFI